MLYPKGNLNSRQLEVRDLALADLESFIRLVAPYQLLGHCHVDLASWIRKHQGEHKLILWPRDHGKSRLAAFYAAWNIVRDPSVTIIYASATAEKAEEQLRFIKNIITSEVVFRYFPGLLNEAEGRRAAWNMTSIIVDHPLRNAEGVVDSTIMTCGLEKTITGKHCQIFIWDDIVVPENNTKNGRKEVNSWVSQAASIMSADSEIFAIGTRYHPKDAYGMMIDMAFDEEVDVDGELQEESISLFTVNQANVEVDEQFLWPRQQRADGKWFGFNQRILAKKRAVYEAAGEITQFYAQYYNDPNDKTTSPIARELFRYYARDKLQEVQGQWFVDGEPLHLYAAVDLAAGDDTTSDYCVVIVGGIDRFANRYVLDVRRYKTSKISVTLQEIKDSYHKWKYKKLRIESVSGFKLVAQDLADSIYDSAIRIPIDLYVPPNFEGKVARVNGLLEPLYQSGAVYHFRGGGCQILEDELVAANPANDDTKDAWAMCVDLMEPMIIRKKVNKNVVHFHPRFGGLAR